MKLIKEDSDLLDEFFIMLGYGNKCTKCLKVGTIYKITRNLINFHCEPCDYNWSFDMGSINNGTKRVKKSSK